MLVIRNDALRVQIFSGKNSTLLLLGVIQNH